MLLCPLIKKGVKNPYSLVRQETKYCLESITRAQEIVQGNSMTLVQHSYYEVLSENIHNAIRRGADSFEAVCRECKGAFPAEVLATAQLFDIEHQSLFSKLAPRNEASMCEWPEPSPMDYEWRFAPESAKAIGRLAQEHGRRILCLGTPTVFCQLISAGADAYLIDRNPLIAAALPNVSSERVVIADIADISPFASVDAFDVVVMDPPWYKPHTLFWLKTAANVVAKNGVIISTIFPELVRPSAKSERAALFRHFEQLGNIDPCVGTVVYETPLFEHETLCYLGIPPMPHWRVADLTVLRVGGSFEPFDAVAPDEEEWVRFRFGTQVVGVKNFRDSNGKITVKSPYEEGSFLLRSVSARDPVRSMVGFWTSRNRAAIITGNARINDLLTKVVEGNSKKLAIVTIGKDAEERAALETLATLIGL